MTTLIASEAGAGHYPENTNYALQKSLGEGVDSLTTAYVNRARAILSKNHSPP